MPLLFYATMSLFRYAVLAEKEEVDPINIIKHLQPENSLWQRWVYLNEDLDPHTTLVEYSVKKNLLSWVRCLLKQGQMPSHVFRLARSEENSAITEFTVWYDIKHQATLHTPGFNYHEISAYRHHLGVLVAKGKITIADLNMCLESDSPWYIILLEGYLLDPLRPNTIPQPGSFLTG